MRTALFTTRADKALPLWEGEVDRIYYYKELSEGIESGYGQVYFRDPFNDPTNPVSDEEIQEVLGKFFQLNPECRSIDNIREVEDFYIEDKWRQYEAFGAEIMPETWRADEVEFRAGEMVLKKRISCRCRDVYFNALEGKDLAEYIVQPILDIAEEMRVFYLNGEVLRTAETRTTKTPTQKVKVTGWKDLTDEQMEFVAGAMRKMSELDFVGVDLAVLRNGSLKLIEVNRSPQFMGYFRTTGVNLAEKVFRQEDL